MTIVRVSESVIFSSDVMDGTYARQFEKREPSTRRKPDPAAEAQSETTQLDLVPENQ